MFVFLRRNLTSRIWDGWRARKQISLSRTTQEKKEHLPYKRTFEGRMNDFEKNSCKQTFTKKIQPCTRPLLKKNIHTRSMSRKKHVTRRKKVMYTHVTMKYLLVHGRVLECFSSTTRPLGSISAAFSRVWSTLLPEKRVRDGAQAPFPNSGETSSLPVLLPPQKSNRPPANRY